MKSGKISVSIKIRVQRKIASSGYKTVETDAVVVLTDVPPINELVEERSKNLFKTLGNTGLMARKMNDEN